jgi:DNA polymerase-3 subunit alpha (Gram-positive type)
LLDVYKVTLEAMSRGIKIGIIDLEKSHQSKFIINRETNTIIAPFKSIAGLGDAVAESIITERNIKKFDSKEDLMQRTKINKNHFAQMVSMGVLDKLSDSSQMSLLDFS